ncbi:MAG: 4-(cytidine 5'-diphospho)-2-C-methyl-D-erythritol kinase [Nitrospiraceae bacterium]|nr:4-(cytidine 5'-diphospho)-2-C-methyl-D-erythritol kinase [Nitrospiraceae bacterium]
MLTLSAPAKINWFIFIPGKRDDGYHEIRSLMQRLDLCDRLTFEPSDSLSLESDCAIPAAENIVWKAALLLKEHAGAEKGARMTLRKNIPVEAGLGGGSSDAAAALLGLDRLWRLGLSRAELSGLAARLGSDVPFFLGPPCAVASGRGEQTSPVSLERPMDLLLVKPSFGVPTGWAYRSLSRYSGLTKTEDNIKLFIRALKGGELGRLEGLGGNDLEAGVLPAFPEIGRIKAALRKEGALYVRMSGSGSAVFGIFPDGWTARKAAAKMDWWCLPARTVCGPENGA